MFSLFFNQIIFRMHVNRQALFHLLNQRIKTIATTSIATTIIKMLDTVTEVIQDRILEHMREYIADIREETQWNESFNKSQNQLIYAARQARRRSIAQRKSVSRAIHQ
jgi:hypothetical protein